MDGYGNWIMKRPKTDCFFAYFSCMLIFSTNLVAADQLPSISSVVSGDAAINAAGNNLTINQSSNRAILDWNSFDIGSDAWVRFNQPSTQSITINNILSTQPAKIDGALSAKGRLFFSSPNGMIFGKDAKVNVDTLLATTHRITNNTANSYELNNAGNGSIINLGQLAANNIYLIGRDVLNAGDINSANGSVGLLAASDLRIAFDAAGLLTATVLSNDLVGTVENTGNITADKIQLKGSASEAAVASTIKNDVTRADTLISENGVLKLVKNKGTLKAKTVELDAGQNGGVEVGGVVATDNLSGKGGLITITGKEVTLTSGARISANGSSGGGDILIGGDWQGTGPLLQSTFATVEAGATVMANATDGGNGGKIVIWSDISNPSSITKVSGALSAVGGPNGGDGGQIETSGKVLDIANIQVSTVGENIGLWLLDPTNVTIDDAYATNLSNALNTTNVTVQADNDIYFGFNNGITKSSGVETTLTLDAGNDIISTPPHNLRTINGAVGSPLSVTINAGNLVQLRWIKIDTKGGDVSFNANQIQSDAAGGAQWAVFADNIQVNSDVFALNATDMNGTSANATSGLFSATSDMNFTIGNHLTLMYTAALKAQGSISINGTLSLVQLRNGSSIETTSGDLTINATTLKQINYLPAAQGSVGGVLNNYINSGSGNLILNVDAFEDGAQGVGQTNGKILVTGAGDFSVGSYSTSFANDFSWNSFYNSNPILNFTGTNYSSYAIGNNDNTARVSIDAPISTTGAVSVTGGIVDGSSNITTTDAASGSITINSSTYSYSGNLSAGAGSTINLNYGSSNQTVDFSKLSGMGTLILTSSGSITQSSAVNVDKLALKGTGSYTLSNSGNSVNTVAAGNDDGSGIGALTFVNSGALTIGSVNPRGVKSNSVVDISTTNGDILITENVAGSSITLNSGANSNAGNPANGNIKVTGSSTINASSSLKLFTGDAESVMGLLQFVNLENVLGSADEGTAGVGNSGAYLISREDASVDFVEASKTTEQARSNIAKGADFSVMVENAQLDKFSGSAGLKAGELKLVDEAVLQDNLEETDGAASEKDKSKQTDDDEEKLAELNNGDKEAGAGGSDENDNEISGELGNQGNDKDVGNAGGERGNKPPVEDPPAEDPPAEDPPAEDPPVEDPPAEDPPVEDPPAEDPPAEDPPAEDPPAEDPPAEDPPAEDPPAEDPPVEDPAVEEDIQLITPVIVVNDDTFEGGDERNIIARELEAVELYSDTFIYQVSDDVFKHTDPAAEIEVSVEMSDGSPLPSWLRYDAPENRIIGNRPTSGPILLEIKLIGRDQYGDSAETVVRIQQGEGQ